MAWHGRAKASGAVDLLRSVSKAVAPAHLQARLLAIILRLLMRGNDAAPVCR